MGSDPLIRRRAGRTLLALLVLALSSAPGLAQKPTWDRVANIKRSALQLAELQQTRGALGTFEHIAACYKTQSLASQFGQWFENCLVLDYLHSKVTAAIYERIPEEERRKNDAPDPKGLIEAMLKRIGGGFSQYKLTEQDARSFLALVEKHGVPTYTAARLGKEGKSKAN